MFHSVSWKAVDVFPGIHTLKFSESKIHMSRQGTYILNQKSNRQFFKNTEGKQKLAWSEVISPETISSGALLEYCRSCNKVIFHVCIPDVQCAPELTIQ